MGERINQQKTNDTEASNTTFRREAGAYRLGYRRGEMVVLGGGCGVGADRQRLPDGPQVLEGAERQTYKRR